MDRKKQWSNEVSAVGFLCWWLENLDYQVRISDSCLRYRSPHSKCETCLAACTKSAIVVQGGKVEITPDRCDGCGECLVSCPVHAIEGILPRRAVSGTALLFSKDYVPAETELLVFNAKGIRTIAYFEDGPDERWMSVVETVNAMLAKLNQPPFAIEAWTPKQLEGKYTRRQLFSLWKQSGKSVLRDLMPAELRFNQRDLDLTTHYPDHQFFHINVAPDRCSLCQACTFVCPYSCIQVSPEKMTLNTFMCVNCHLCTDVCPEQAMMVEPQISPRRTTELDVVENTCAGCGVTFFALDTAVRDCVLCRKIWSSLT
jgi:ferredoxin